MGKAARLAQQERRRAAAAARAAAPPPARKPPGRAARVVEVEPGYPGLGWREDVVRIDRQIRTLRERQRRAVAQALAAGVTFSEIGRAFGVSRQAARARFGHLKVRVATGAAPPPGGVPGGPSSRT